MALDRALAGFGLARAPARSEAANTTQSTISSSASRQFRNSDSGSSTSSDTNAARCSRKKPSHSHHSESVPVSMIFISRPECGAAVKAERQLQDVLEIVGHHHVAAAVRQPVGVQRDQRPADDGEEPERRPRRRAASPDRTRPARALGLRAGQRIDDAAEQHRLGELGGRQRHVGERQHPAEPGLLAEQLQHAHVQTDEIHGLGITASSWRLRKGPERPPRRGGGGFAPMFGTAQPHYTLGARKFHPEGPAVPSEGARRPRTGYLS